MNSFVPLLAGIAVCVLAAYLRIRLLPWTIATAVAIACAGWLAGSSIVGIAVPLLLLALVAVPLNLPEFRRRKLSAPLLALFRKATPQLSDTEQIADRLRPAAESGDLELRESDSFGEVNYIMLNSGS